jgi:hypothetical protein
MAAAYVVKEGTNRDIQVSYSASRRTYSHNTNFKSV